MARATPASPFSQRDEQPRLHRFQQRQLGAQACGDGGVDVLEMDVDGARRVLGGERRRIDPAEV